MVTRWGMSDKLGPLHYAEGEEEVFLGYSRQHNMSMSNETAQAIDKEIRQIVDAGYDRAKSLLTEHRGELETLALALLEYETLSGDEIKTIIAGGSIDRGRSAKPALPDRRLVDPQEPQAEQRDSAARRPPGPDALALNARSCQDPP